MGCPDCKAEVGRWHWRGCLMEQCPYCGGPLKDCGCSPPLDDRIPWSGTCSWLTACVEFGFFERQDGEKWVACDVGHPDSQPDLSRLLSECVWNREEKRFELP